MRVPHVMQPYETSSKRRERHAVETENSQAKLRASIAETERLVGETDLMLGRHRQECEDQEG
jgi:hypothetical protein